MMRRTPDSGWCRFMRSGVGPSSIFARVEVIEESGTRLGRVRDARRRIRRLERLGFSFDVPAGTWLSLPIDLESR